ncbi:MAG TPA: DUF937 domain-containing protein [Azoarcus taiwanensis]|nr:DUF937 domain-containing protein [Azoarcus taiwanensis]
MQVEDLLKQMGGLGSVARELGVDERQARSGAEALLPAILGGFKRQAQAQPAGAGGLLDVLGRLGGGGLMDEVIGAQPTNLEHGNQVLGQIFGSKDVSRAVAQNAAGQTGLDPNVLKKMLPMLGMLVAGYMSKQGAAPQPAAAPASGLGDMLGGRGAGRPAARGGAGGLADMLDLDGDGNPLNDVLGMLGKLKR